MNFHFRFLRFLPSHWYHPFLDYNIAQIFTLFKMEICTKLTSVTYIKRRNLVKVHINCRDCIDIEQIIRYHRSVRGHIDLCFFAKKVGLYGSVCRTSLFVVATEEWVEAVLI